ncbi:MAG: hypothetical protein OHK0022_16600 [Roseiflexaceae bacterium]
MTTDAPLDPRLAELLRQLSPRVRPERFALIGMHPRERPVALRLLGLVQSPFVQLISEPELLTLLLPERDWTELRPAFRAARVQSPLRAISFDVDLPDDLVGLMAALAGALAGAGVPLLAVCTFARDHLLVREADLERALAALVGLRTAQETP